MTTVQRLYTSYRSWEYIYEYNGEFYTADGLNEHDLYLIDDEIYHSDDVCFPEDTGDATLIDDCYQHSDGNYYTYEEEITGLKLKSYHGSNIVFEQNHQPSGWRIGFEIEKVDHDVLNDGDNYDIHKYGWDAEEDSSLSDGGFELVSKVYDLHSDQMLQDIENLKYYIDAGYDDTCGGHINLSWEGKTKYDILERLQGSAPLLYAMYYNRLDSRWCKAKKEGYGAERYEAFNLTKSSNILELRLFSAVKNVENLKFRIKLIRELSLQNYTPFKIIASMVTDTPLADILKTVYTPEKYTRLIDRVVLYSNEYLNYSTPAILERRINKLKNNLN